MSQRLIFIQHDHDSRRFTLRDSTAPQRLTSGQTMATGLTDATFVAVRPGDAAPAIVRELGAGVEVVAADSSSLQLELTLTPTETATPTAEDLDWYVILGWGSSFGPLTLPLAAAWPKLRIVPRLEDPSP